MKTTLKFLSTVYCLLSTSAIALAADPIGTLKAPQSVVTDPGDLGPVFFTNVVRLIIVIAGLWAFIQFLLGGLGFISAAGDAKKTQEAQQKILHAIIGLAIIAASFIISALIGSLFLGDPAAILNPRLQTIN